MRGPDGRPAGGSKLPVVPAVSVCIPTYNYARFLPRAIESVLAQTFRDFELIVVDDASSDHTPEVLRRFADPRLRVFQNSVNLGLFPNFSYCLTLAKAPLIKFLCADDWLDPRYLEQATAVLRDHPQVGFVTSAGYLVDEAGRVYGRFSAGFADRPVVPALTAIEAQARFLNVIGMPSNVLLRRHAVDAVGGFDNRFTPAADVHLWLKLLCRYDLGWLPDPLCFMRMHSSKSHSYGAKPSESTFLSWKDVAGQPGSRIGSETLDIAMYAEAERSLLHVGALVAAGKLRSVVDILRFTARHVSWSRVLPRFAWRLPALLWAQIRRVHAVRSRRIVIYGRTLRTGGPLAAEDRPGPAARCR